MGDVEPDRHRSHFPGAGIACFVFNLVRPLLTVVKSQTMTLGCLDAEWNTSSPPRPITLSQLNQRFTAAGLFGTSNTQKIQTRTTNDEYQRQHDC